MKSTLLRYMVIAFVPLMAASCGKAARKEAQPSVEVAHSGAVFHQGAGKLAILPENPMANSRLRAVYNGPPAPSIIYSWEVNGQEVEGASGETFEVGLFKKGDEVKVTAFAVGAEYTASTTIGNRPPDIKGVSFTPAEVRAGDEVKAVVEADDPDGELVTIEYEWDVNGERVYGAGESLDGRGLKRGDRITLRVTPGDGADHGKPFAPPALTVANTLPRFTSAPAQPARGRFVYKPAATDIDGDEVRFSLSEAPEGMAIGADGKIDWDLKDKKNGTVKVKVTADDGNGGKAFQEFTLQVTQPEANK